FFERLENLHASRVRVLSIDDSERNRRVIRAMLKHTSCELLEAGDAKGGIREAHLNLPDVILMDIQMPEMDGLAATAVLKADEKTSSIPIIAVTAHAMRGDSERALAAGCVAFVSKPISRAKLEEAIDLALGGPHWREAAESA
ncbi:MAG: response regulator, partial [Minicystis sp.]